MIMPCISECSLPKSNKKSFYLDRPRFGFGEQTEQESSEQLLTELFDGVRAP